MQIGSPPTCLVLAGAFGFWSCARVSDFDGGFPDRGTMSIVSTLPEDGAVEVEPDATLDLCWSVYLDPRSVSAGGAAVSSGSARFDSATSLQLFPWRGPGGRSVDRLGPWCPGSVLSITPKAPLIEGVHFRLTVVGTAIGWNGEAIDVGSDGWYASEDDTWRFNLEFTVRESLDVGSDIEEVGPPSPPPYAGAPTLAELFDEGRVFDPGRNACSCHRTPGERARALLDLTSPVTAAADLIGSSRLRDTGFPMVNPRNPSESFLLHKLLRRPDGTRLYGILGDAMPPHGPLPYPDLVDLARWIEAGAQ